MKRFLTILTTLLVLTLVLSLTGCGGGSGSSSSSEAAPPASSGAPETPSSSTEEVPEDAIQSVDDLAGKTIGVQQGTTGDFYAEDIEGATVERFNKGAEAVMALQQGKVDAVMIDDQPARIYAAQNDDIKVLDEPFTEEEYAICVAKGNTELTQAMNAAIAELKADGTLDAIKDYYIGGVEGAKSYESPADVDRSKGTLIMATNAEFPPYEYHEAGDIKGLDVDFARAICDKMGYDLKVDDMAFDSIIAAVQSGKADFGAAGMTVREDRLVNVDFTDTYVTATQAIIVKK